MKKTFILFALSTFLIFTLSADPRQLYTDGQKAQLKGNWYEAIEYYKSALIENPSYNAVYQGLAECFYELGEYDQALDYVKSALRYKTNSPELKNLHGFILIGLKDLSGAKLQFEQVLASAPNDVDARFGLAEIEVMSGKLIAATELYKAALARQGQNRKALLSLAILSFEDGNKNLAKNYITQALRYHGENPEVHYFAAYLSALENDLTNAQARLNTALQLKPDFDKAKQLLSNVMYAQGKYIGAIRLADERIAENRNYADAWYIKTLSNLKLNDYNAAIQSARVGLSIEPNNEIMRCLLESIALDHLGFEDNYRKQLAQFHEQKAKTFVNLNNIQSAIYEYRQALKVYPYNTDCRFEYAKLLLRQGYYERYLEQLRFIQSLTQSNTKVNDAVESYGKLLSTSLQSVWNINPLYLEKGHISISLFYEENTSNVLHPEAEKFATQMTAEMFDYNRRFTMTYFNEKSSSYSESFRKARADGSDYFGILRLEETERDIKLSLDLYVSRTGSLAKQFTVFRSGNERYANALIRLSNLVSDSMPFISKIVKRNGQKLLIDLGKNDGNFSNLDFVIIEDGKLSFEKEGIGVKFDESAVLATFIPGRSEEDLTEGTFKRVGYYDRVNEKDWCVAVPKTTEQQVIDVVNTYATQPIILEHLVEIRKSY